MQSNERSEKTGEQRSKITGVLAGDSQPAAIVVEDDDEATQAPEAPAPRPALQTSRMIDPEEEAEIAKRDEAARKAPQAMDESTQRIPTQPNTQEEPVEQRRPPARPSTCTVWEELKWIDGHALGKFLPKDAATHHDSKSFKYLVFKEHELARLRNIIIERNLVCPLFLNEHAPPYCRLHLDLDVNKKIGDPLVSLTDVSDFCLTAAPFLERLVGKGHLNLLDPTSQIIDCLPDAWRAHATSQAHIWQWYRCDKILAFSSKEIVAQTIKGMDRYLAVVLQSQVKREQRPDLHQDPGLADEFVYSYHIIWPFISFDRCNGKVRDLLVDAFKSCVPQQCASTAGNYIDGGVWQRGALRGCFCDSFTHGDEEGPQHRPYEFSSMVHRCEEQNQPEALLSSVRIWASSSLLFPCPTPDNPRKSGVQASEKRAAAPGASVPQPAGAMEEEGEQSSRHDSGHEPPQNRRKFDPFEGKAEKWGQHPIFTRAFNAFQLPDLAAERTAWVSNRDELAAEDIGRIMRGAWADMIPEDKADAETIERIVQLRLSEFLNHFFAFVPGAGWIGKKWDTDSKYPEILFYKPQDFHELLKQTVTVSSFPPNKQPKSVKLQAYELYSTSDFRLSFSRIVCLGGEHPDVPDKALNIFWPNAISREDAAAYSDYEIVRNGEIINLEYFKRFIFEGLCDNDVKTFNYFRWWLASVVQHPETKLGTALFLNGPEGAGKDTIMDCVGAVLGKSQYFNTASLSDLGRFNLLVATRALVLINEVRSLDNAQLAMVKALITDTETRVEQKFKDAFVIQNHMNVVLQSNMVNTPPFAVSYNARRWFMPMINQQFTAMPEYWVNIVAWLGSKGVSKFIATPGRKCVAHWLLSMEIPVDWNPRILPPSKALARATQAVFHTVWAWWYESLASGYIAGFSSSKSAFFQAHQDHPPGWLNSSIEISRQKLWECFTTWLAMPQNTFQVKNGMSDVGTWYAKLMEICPDLHQKLFEETRVDALGRQQKNLAGRTDPRNVVVVPSIADCKKLFNKKIRDVDWEVFDIPQAPAADPQSDPVVPLWNNCDTMSQVPDNCRAADSHLSTSSSSSSSTTLPRLVPLNRSLPPRNSSAMSVVPPTNRSSTTEPAAPRIVAQAPTMVYSPSPSPVQVSILPIHPVSQTSFKGLGFPSAAKGPAAPQPAAAKGPAAPQPSVSAELGQGDGFALDSDLDGNEWEHCQ